MDQSISAAIKILLLIKRLTESNNYGQVTLQSSAGELIFMQLETKYSAKFEILLCSVRDTVGGLDRDFQSITLNQ